MNVVRVVYKKADGSEGVAMVEDAPTKVRRRVYMEGGIREMCLVQQDVLGVIHKGEAVDHAAVPMPGIDHVFKMATQVAGRILEKVYANGARDEEIDIWGQELTKGVAEVVTIAMAARLPKFPDIAGPEGDPVDPSADPTLAGTPRRKQADPDDPNPKLPHLDALRGPRLAALAGPPVITNAPSKSMSKALEDLGFEGEGEQDGIEIWKHADLKHVIEVDTETGAFKARSGWNRESVARGEGVEDIHQWIAEEEQL